MDDMTPLHEVSDAVCERVFSVNVDGPFRLSRAVIPSTTRGGLRLDRERRVRSRPPRVRRRSRQERIGAAMQMLPPLAEPEQLAASSTFLLSDDGTNVSGAIMPSDGGWSSL
jgi:NAD(P)-dependent dehydrogenase (short-subunit alcohol dehydrogenase family)